jgi:hypothetical protein
MKHSLHCFMFKVGSARLHNLHMRRFFRIRLQVLQICSARVGLSRFPLASEAAVLMIRVFTSFSPSIDRTLPLTW